MNAFPQTARAEKAVLFDWNGTLLDDFDAMHECMNVIMARAGRDPVTAEFFRTHYEVPFERLYANFGFGAEEIEHMMTLDRDIFYHHYEPMADKAPLRAGAAEILRDARAAGIETLILSNHIEGPIRTQLKRLEIEHFFTEVLAFADRPTHFRDMDKGERLRRFIERRGADPERMIIVGDSVEEIEIGRAQGVVSVAITGGCCAEQRLRTAAPDHVIHSLPELKSVMQERGFL